MAYVVRGKSGKVVGRYATRGEAEARIAQLRAGVQRLQRYQFSPGDDFKRGRGTKRAPGGRAQHHKWVARGEGLYGRNGGVISGGFHDDWPASVKETIRRLAHGYTKLRDAAVAHLKASRLRGIQ